MSERAYRFFFSALLLLSLYSDVLWLMYGLCGIFLLEGITNARVPQLLQLIRGQHKAMDDADISQAQQSPAINFEAERVVRLGIGILLLVSYLLPTGIMWFAPWLIGFTLLGSAVSGVCPLLISMKWLGFR